MSALGEGHHQDQQAEILAMIPRKVVVQGTKERVKRAGHAYDAKHEAILPKPMVNGRLHTLPSYGPRMASPAAAVKTFPLLPPKKSVKMSKLTKWF